ncbi:MAG: membrane protein insertase YidC [Lachnospiraceae bacterium]|nr:membrane protein insertase YidC [Lachnospiraceae bacterium]
MQQAEIQALNEKYGFSPMGGCLPLLVEMPIIIALYQVIYRIPAYVSSIRGLYQTVVNAALAHGGDFVTKITDLAKAVNVDPTKVDLTGATDASINNIIDMFAKFDATKWNTFYESFSGIQSQVGTTVDHLTRSNTFLGINLMERPELLGISILIPILAGVFQFLAAKTMQVAPANNDDPNAGMMKGMNATMPLISVVFCFMLPCGVGLYWVASSAIRFIQQVAVNGFLKNSSVEDIIEKNIEKRNKKREKQGLPPIRENASQNVRNLQRMKEEEERRERVLKERAAAARAEAGDAVNQPARQAPGGIAARAGMVKDFNERTKK